MSDSGLNESSERDREAARRAHQVTQRAIRRLDILEWIMVAAGVGAAVLGGWAIAWILAGAGNWDFRSTWIVAAVALFVVGGGATIIQIRRDARAVARRIARNREDDG